MILRSPLRLQRQLQRQFQDLSSSHALSPLQQTRLASSKSLRFRSRTAPPPFQRRDRCTQLNILDRRCLATHATGFEGHLVPSLPHGEKFAEHGVEGFLSREGFDLAWTQYQSMMVENLNNLTYGTADATSKPIYLVSKYARSAEKSSLFNYASMAANNHFFFSCLSPNKTEPSPTFLSDIDDSFSSYDTLRTEIIETADAMFGPGFVWIVKDQEAGRMKLLCTYLAGSPYPEAHNRSQQLDMATQATRTGPNGEPLLDPYRSLPVNNSVGSFGRHTKLGGFNQRSVNRYNAQPVLCVNTWEHAFLRDYGVGGKRTYLQRWWDRVDWAVVENHAQQAGPERANMYNHLESAFRKFGHGPKL